jgi:PAS domain S-box-containing protein
VSPQTSWSSESPARNPDPLLQNEERLRILMDAVPDLIFRLNSAGVYVDWKPGIDGELLVPPEQFLGRHFREILPRPVSDRVADAIERSRRTKAVETIEYELTLPEGGRQYYEARIRVTSDGDVLAVCRNVTERRKLIAAVESSEQRFRALVENSFDGCSVLDATGTIVYDNAGETLLLGYGMAEVIGHSAFEYIHPDDAPRCRDVLTSLLENPQQVLTTQVRCRHKDGTWRWIETTARNLLDHPAVQGIVTNWRDITEQVQASAAIGRNRERLSALVENGHSGINVLDLQGHVLYSAPSNCRILGYASDEVLDQSCFDYVHPDDMSLARTSFERTLHSGERVTFPRFRVRDACGQWRWIEAAGRNLSDLPSVGGIVINWHDITEHVRAEAEQRRAAELFQAVADGTPDAIFVKDRTGRYLFANPAAARFAGMPLAAMLGQDAITLFGAVGARLIGEHDRRVMEQNRPETRDDRLMVGGVVRTFQTIKAPYRDEHDNVIGVLGISRDVTSRIEMEQALRDREERYRSLFESSSDAIFVNKGGRIILANPALVQLLGCDSVEQVLGKTPYDIIHPDYHEIVRERIQILFEEHRPVPFVEQKLVRMDGSTVEIEIAATPFEDQGESAIHVTARDITARKQAERKLAQQHAELLHISRLSTMGQMVAAMSHELSQPLTAATNFAAALAALLESPAGLDAAALAECNAQVIQQCARAAAILQRLRFFGRKTPPQRVRCDLRKVLHDSLALVQNELAQTNVRAQFDLAPEIVEVEADSVQLQQVVVNLLLNARDAMQAAAPPRRVIVITTAMQSGEAVIEFEDRGVGIADDVAPHLFQPFFTTKPAGMGIGLSICHTIIHEHGGRIAAANNAHGGATFRCWLPAAGESRPL